MTFDLTKRRRAHSLGLVVALFPWPVVAQELQTTVAEDLVGRLPRVITEPVDQYPEFLRRIQFTATPSTSEEDLAVRQAVSGPEEALLDEVAQPTVPNESDNGPSLPDGSSPSVMDNSTIASSSDNDKNASSEPSEEDRPAEPVTPTWSLSLGESVQVGLANNRDVSVLSPLPGIADTLVAIERGEFDPVVGGSLFGGQDDRQVRSTIATFGAPTNVLKTDYLNPYNTLNNVYLRQKLMVGSSYEVGMGTNYARFDPRGVDLLVPSGWDSSLNVRFIQPLARGRGEDVTTARLRIAQANRKQSTQDFLASIRIVVREIDLAYWQLAGAHQKELTAKKYVEIADTFNSQEIERQKLGLSARPQLVQSQSILSEFRVSYIMAKRDTSVAEMRLRKQLGLAEYIYQSGAVSPYSCGSQFELPIEPSIDRSKTEESLNLDEAISLAMSRPELQAQQIRLEGLQYAMIAAKNNLLPDLKAYALYSANGLEKGLDDSLSTALGGSFQTWGAGLTYEQRVLLRSERADVRRVFLLITQEQARMNQITHDIVAELRVAKAQADGSRDVLQERFELVESYRDQMEVLDALYQDGQATLFQLLDTSRLLQNAELDLAEAWTLYQTALANWRYARGDSASNYGIVLDYSPDDLAPGVSRSTPGMPRPSTELTPKG